MADAEAIDVVEDYVERIATGDTAAADSLRCAAHRYGPRHADLLADTRSITDQLGQLDIESAEVVERADESWSVSVVLAGAEAAVVVAVVSEESSPRLCGQSTPGWPSVRDELSDVAVTTMQMSSPVEDVMECGSSASASMHAASTEVAPVPSPDDPDGTVERFSSVSQDQDDDTEVRITWTDHQSAPDAIAYQFNAEGIYLDNTTEVLPTQHVQNARAVRYVSRSRTLIQPAGIGEHWDVSMARYDDVLVVISRGPVAASSDPTPLVRVAECVGDLARDQ